MKKRIITAIVAILIFAPICIFSEYIIYPIAMSILAAVGVFEIAKCIGFHKKLVLTIPAYIVALALPILRFFLSNKSKPNSVFMLYAMASVFVLLVFLSVLIVLLNLMPTKIATETQFTRLLGNTPLQVKLELMHTTTHVAKKCFPRAPY